MGKLSWILRRALNAITRVPYKKEAEGHQTEEAMWPQRQRLEGYSHQPKNASSHQKLKDARNGFFPGASGGNTVLPTP